MIYRVVDIFDTWPDAEDIRGFDETLGQLGDIGSLHYIHVLVDYVSKTRCGEEPGVPVEYWGPDDFIEQAESLGLVVQDRDQWVLTELGIQAGQLYTAEGDPPDGIELCSCRMEANREVVRNDLT